jgi:hypothetical protein
MLKTINKLDVAVAQLETALELYFLNGCRISVTTLAGAAEEILGRYVEIKGEETALSETIRIVCLLHKKRCGVTPKHAPIKARANFAKNSFKHMDLESDFDITVDVEEEAIAMTGHKPARQVKRGPVRSRENQMIETTDTPTVCINYRFHAAIIIALLTAYSFTPESYRFIGPVIGFLLIGFVTVSRSLRLLTKAKPPTEYLWNKNDYWKYPFGKREKLSLIYGLSLFLGGFLP